MENNNLTEHVTDSSLSENTSEEYTPKLFSEDQTYASDKITQDSSDQENDETNQLFDQDINEEEDFEIPAFLRKQKF